MKLIIDIPEEDRKDIGNIHFVREGLKFKIGKAIMNGTPLDDVIEDIKAAVFKQSEQTNERFSHDWNEGFNDGMFHTLTIIREYFKHISVKESE